MVQGTPEVCYLCCLCSGGRRNRSCGVNQRGFIPAFLIPYIGYGLAGLAVVAILSLAVHKYNEWIREPYKQQIALWEKTIERNKQEAQALLKKREQENADLAEKWRNYARESDESYQNKIDHLRAYRNAAGGVRLSAGCGASGSSAGQAGEGNTEAPKVASSGSGTSDAPREFAFDESAVAQVLEWYAYGLSCHAFVNGK